MSLLRTKTIQVGTVLAFTGVSPAEGLTFFYGSAAEFALEAGDVVKVIDIDRSREKETPFARVTVAVLKGKFVGRVGQVSIDLSARLQRSWQTLTETGSMAPVRTTGKHPRVRERESEAYSIIVDKESRGVEEAPTKPASHGGMKHGRCA